LLEDIEVTDDDTIETLNKKQNARLQKVVNFLNKKLDEVTAKAVEEATRPSREKEAASIKEFEKDHPGMKNPDVIALMQPLYNKGKTLEECYNAACKALELDPTTGNKPEDGKDSKEQTKAKDNKSVKTSAKSLIPDDSGIDPDDKKGEDVTLEDIFAKNSNEFIAKHGNPFETK
jgi:hypothetical protein